MHPAAERIALVDRRAREEVRKAEEYIDGVRLSLAAEEREIRAGAERLAVEKAEEVRREAEERVDREIEKRRLAAEEKFRGAENAGRIEALARLAVSNITGREP